MSTLVALLIVQIDCTMYYRCVMCVCRMHSTIQIFIAIYYYQFDLLCVIKVSQTGGSVTNGHNGHNGQAAINRQHSTAFIASSKFFHHNNLITLKCLCSLSVVDIRNTKTREQWEKNNNQRVSEKLSVWQIFCKCLIDCA